MRAETRKHGSFDKRASGAQNPLMPLAVRLPFILLSTVSYLALAILGRGGFAAFFSVPALIALAVAFCAMSGVALFTGGNLSSGVREDRSNRWVIGAFGVIGLLLAVVPAWADRREIWILDGDTVRWLGVILFAIGGTLRCGRCLFSAAGSAAWSPSSPGMRWSRAVSTASSGILVIWDYW